MSAPSFDGPVLLTGASGFVGSHLARRLVSAGVEVHAIVRPTSSLAQLKEAAAHVVPYVHDGTTESMLAIVRRVGPTVVYHLGSNFVAQHASAHVEGLIQANVLFGTQLAEAMIACGAGRLVNTGTFWQHFRDEDYLPASLYAATKQAFEDILAYYVDATSLQVVSLHLSDTYGPDDPRPKLIRLLSTVAESGETLAMSEGRQELDLVHIDDVVTAFLMAGERLMRGDTRGHEVFAVSAGTNVTLRELVAIYGRVAGRELPIEFGARPYRDREVMKPWRGGRPLPGWAPTITLEAGLRRLVVGG